MNTPCLSLTLFDIFNSFPNMIFRTLSETGKQKSEEIQLIFFKTEKPFQQMFIFKGNLLKDTLIKLM